MPVPACGYSPAGEPFDACLYIDYSTTVGSLFGVVFPCCVFIQENSRLSNIIACKNETKYYTSQMKGRGFLQGRILRLQQVPFHFKSCKAFWLNSENLAASSFPPGKAELGESQNHTPVVHPKQHLRNEQSDKILLLHRRYPQTSSTPNRSRHYADSAPSLLGNKVESSKI